MCGLRIAGKEVPNHVGIFQMRLRVSLLRVDEHLELEGRVQYVYERSSVEFRERLPRMDRARRRWACCYQPYPKDLVGKSAQVNGIVLAREQTQTFVRVHLDREATWITDGIGRATFAR